MDNITINQTDKTNNNPKKRIEKDDDRFFFKATG